MTTKDAGGEAGGQAPAGGSTRIPIALALTAVALRLLPLQWLHPINWDELEFYSASRWIAEGRLPFRDFWEHHTPLVWFLFAPFTHLSDSPGVAAILAMRWVQLPVWVAVFWLLDVWMRGEGLGRSARWSAIALALCSSFFMLPAVEFRVEAVGALCVVASLLLIQRERWFAAGVVVCLAVLANLRLGPMLAIAVVIVLASTRGRAWRVVAGGAVALLIFLAYFAAAGALPQLWQQLWVDNTAEKFATPVIAGFVHRLLVPFGVRILGSDRLFELAAVDTGGVALILLGAVSIVQGFRRGGSFRFVAVLQLANLAFVAWMKFIYNYHFALAIVLMVPLLASWFDGLRRKQWILFLLVLAWCNHAFGALFRGKELDLAYQDRIMREVDSRTRPGDQVWSGVPWAIRREPAYRFWFLPELARLLVRVGAAEPWIVRVPPAALVVDHNAQVWISSVQRSLAVPLIRHYIPVWRELWMPALNARLRPGTQAHWIVPRDGDYRVYASAELARHPWFRDPLLVASYRREDAVRFTLRLPAPSSGDVDWTVDGREVTGSLLRLRAGSRVTAASRSTKPIGVIALSTGDRVLFRQPPAGVTLEGEMTRVTHVPHPGAQIAP